MSKLGRPPISTHILDTSRGVAAAGVKVTLYKQIVADSSQWQVVQTSETNLDGRCGNLIGDEEYAPGTYKLHFDVGKYYAATNTQTLYPFVEIVFECSAGQQHYHVPLLLNPFGYSTYRGT